MPLALYFLALAVFAMGTSEFMLAGLVPAIAGDLHVSVGSAGLLTSAFAVGMVVGAPCAAALARQWPARGTLAAFVAVFAAAHVAGAFTPGFAPLLVTRVVAAVANAGFLAVALATATALVPPARTGRALAVLLSGTTLATVAGVPGGAVLGTLLGWRATFAAIAVLCLPALAGVVAGVQAQAGVTLAGGPAPARVVAGVRTPAGEATRGPAPAGEVTGGPAPAGVRAPGPSLRTELARLKRPRLPLVMTLAALVNAATFATFTFLSPIVTGTARLGPVWVPVTLVLFGAGSFAGVTAAGRLADRRPGTVLATAGPALLLGWVALALLAASPAAVLCLAFTQGALAFLVGGTVITRVLHEAAAPTMGGSYVTAALNLGAATGPAVAAYALAGRGGGVGPVWVSAALVGGALALAAMLRGVSGRTGERGVPDGTE